MPQIDIYLNGQVIARSDVTNSTTLVSICQGISNYLDTNANRMDAFTCEFRYYEFVVAYNVRSIKPETKPFNIIVPSDLLVPAYSQFTVGDLPMLNTQSVEAHLTVRPRNTIRIDLEPALGMGAALPNTVIERQQYGYHMKY